MCCGSERWIFVEITSSLRLCFLEQPVHWSHHIGPFHVTGRLRCGIRHSSHTDSYKNRHALELPEVLHGGHRDVGVFEQDEVGMSIRRGLLRASGHTIVPEDDGNGTKHVLDRRRGSVGGTPLVQVGRLLHDKAEVVEGQGIRTPESRPATRQVVFWIVTVVIFIYVLLLVVLLCENILNNCFYEVNNLCQKETLMNKECYFSFYIYLFCSI